MRMNCKSRGRVYWILFRFLLWVSRPVRAVGTYRVYHSRTVGNLHFHLSYRDSLRLTRRLDELKLHPETERLLFMMLSQIDAPD